MNIGWKGVTILSTGVLATVVAIYQFGFNNQESQNNNASLNSNHVPSDQSSQIQQLEQIENNALKKSPLIPQAAIPRAPKLAPGTVLPEGHRALNDLSPSHVAEFKASRKNFTHFQIGNRNVKSIYTSDNAIWVGTSGGAIRYEPKTDDYQLFNVRNGLLANGVFNITQIGHRIAIGTYGGGLAMLDDKTKQWQIYNVPEGLGDAFVYGTLQMKNGDVWIATWTGANRIRGGNLDNPDSWEVFTVENTNGGVPNDWVYALAEGKNGELWMATEGGLARYHNEKWQNWKHADGLGAPYEKVKEQNQFKNDPAKFSSHHAKQKIQQGLQNVDGAYNPNYIIALAVDQQGYVWAGTWGGGLSRFDGTNWKTYTVSDGLPANHIFMLHVDKDNNLWAGTSKGLARFSSSRNQIKIFNTSHGLFSDTVFSMAIQDNGTYWIGSFGGVAKIKELN